MSSLQGVIIKWQEDFSKTNQDLINYMSNYGSTAIIRMEMSIFVMLLVSYFNLNFIYNNNSLHLIIGDNIIYISQAISFLLSTISILYNTQYSPGIGVFINIIICFKILLLLILLSFVMKFFITYIYHLRTDSSITLYSRAVNSSLVAFASLFTSIFLQLSMKIHVTKDEVTASIRNGIIPYERLLRKNENNYVNLESPTKEMKVKRTAVIASSGFTIGAKVLAKYKSDKLWFPGRISALHKNNTFDIVYDDGDIEFYKTREAVELLSSLVLMEVQDNESDIANGLISMWKWSFFLHLVITCFITLYSTLLIALDGLVTDIISTLLSLSIDMMIIGTIIYIIITVIKVMSALYRFEFLYYYYYYYYYYYKKF